VSNMKKTLPIISSVLFLLSAVSPVSAAFLTVTKDGSVRTNVLGDATSEKGDMKVASVIASAKQVADATLSIIKDGEKSFLSIESPTGNDRKDVTSLTQDIVEIEQDDAPKTITIGKVDDNFGISQAGITALTSYPIHINAEDRTISVATGSGERIVHILPDEAVETLVRANIINVLSQDGQVVLGESDTGELTYSIPAERNINLFNIHTVQVPVNTTVSATSGKVLKIDQPKWLTLFGFLFS